MCKKKIITLGEISDKWTEACAYCDSRRDGIPPTVYAERLKKELDPNITLLCKMRNMSIPIIIGASTNNLNDTDNNITEDESDIINGNISMNDTLNETPNSAVDGNIMAEYSKMDDDSVSSATENSTIHDGDETEDSTVTDNDSTMDLDKAADDSAMSDDNSTMDPDETDEDSSLDDDKDAEDSIADDNSLNDIKPKPEFVYARFDESRNN